MPRQLVVSSLTCVRLFEAISTNTFTRHPGPALAAYFSGRGSVWMVFAHRADAETNFAIRINCGTRLAAGRL
jgi:hypothetical protein